jgi:hypothetical protein
MDTNNGFHGDFKGATIKGKRRKCIILGIVHDIHFMICRQVMCILHHARLFFCKVDMFVIVDPIFSEVNEESLKTQIDLSEKFIFLGSWTDRLDGMYAWDPTRGCNCRLGLEGD